MNSYPYFIDLPRHDSFGKDWFGGLVAAEQGAKGAPFPIKRVYWVTGVGDLLHRRVERGGHAHYRGEQLFFCLSGSILFRATNGTHMMERELYGSWPSRGLYMPPLWWHTLTYKKGSICLAMASLPYDESDYIRKREDFDRMVNTRRSA